MSAELPQFLRDLIASPPSAGSGLHQWLFKVSRQLHAHRSRDEIIDLLAAATDGCGRRVPAREICGAVDDAEKCAYQLPANGSRPSQQVRTTWPALNEPLRSQIIASSRATVLDLLDAPGPDAWSVLDLDPEQVIDELFPGNPLLCLGFDNSKFATMPRESWRGHVADHSLIVPSPMSAPTGKTMDGKVSAHTLDNTGPRKWLVTEFDFGTFDEQLRVILHLRQWGRLHVITESGGKSLHAWWLVDHFTDERNGKFFMYAVSLGADPMTWTRSQFVRIPGGFRADKQARQSIVFFQPPT